MIAKTVPANVFKSTLDGYHGVELAEEDRHKTTFDTEWGLYRYRRVTCLPGTAMASTLTLSGRTELSVDLAEDRG